MLRKALCGVAAILWVVLSGALGQPAHAETNCYQSDSSSCRERCEEKREKDYEKCRKIPKKEKDRREACWRAANEAYARCVKDCDD